MMGPLVAGCSGGASVAVATRTPGPTAIQSPSTMVRRIRIKVATSPDFDAGIIAKCRQAREIKSVKAPGKSDSRPS